jgi:Na+-transporting NADH:ubiquinone oxidoreductase subunit NqrD
MTEIYVSVFLRVEEDSDRLIVLVLIVEEVVILVDDYGL